MINWIPSLLITTLTTSFAYASKGPYALGVDISRPEPVQSITEVFPVTEPEAPQSFDLQVALDSGFNNLTPLLTQVVYSETLHFASGHNSTGKFFSTSAGFIH